MSCTAQKPKEDQLASVTLYRTCDFVTHFLSVAGPKFPVNEKYIWSPSNITVCASRMTPTASLILHSRTDYGSASTKGEA